MGSSAISWRGRGATFAVCALCFALALPEWVPRRWSREDGPVEWAGFACLLLGGICAVLAAGRLRPDRRAVLLAAALGAVLLVAAGEEISWGQRLFEIETPEILIDDNHQDELNLHNLAGVQRKAIVAQLGIAGIGVALPWVVRRAAWARIGFPCFAGYLVYRAGRGLASILDWGASDRNSEVSELVLSLGLFALAARLLLGVVRGEVRTARS